MTYIREKWHTRFHLRVMNEEKSNKIIQRSHIIDCHFVFPSIIAILVERREGSRLLQYDVRKKKRNEKKSKIQRFIHTKRKKEQSDEKQGQRGGRGRENPDGSIRTGKLQMSCREKGQTTLKTFSTSASHWSYSNLVSSLGISGLRNRTT